MKLSPLRSIFAVSTQSAIMSRSKFRHIAVGSNCNWRTRAVAARLRKTTLETAWTYLTPNLWSSCTWTQQNSYLMLKLYNKCTLIMASPRSLPWIFFQHHQGNTLELLRKVVEDQERRRRVSSLRDPWRFPKAKEAHKHSPLPWERCAFQHWRSWNINTPNIQHG